MTKYTINKDDISDYVAGYNDEDAKKNFRLRKVIKLASNENPYKVPVGLKWFLKKKIKNIYRYPDQDYKEIKAVLSKKLKLSTGEIFPGNGSDEILDLIFKALIKPKEKVLLFEPSFSVYTILSDIYKAAPIRINMINFQYNLDTMLKKLSKQIKLVVICNPNNPTGTYLNSTDMERLIIKLPSNTTLCIDEAYYDYADSGDFPDMIKLYKKYGSKKSIIVTRTFSKIYAMAGLRIGYAFSNSEFIGLINAIRIPFNVNMLAEKASIYALQREKITQKSRKRNTENKAFFCSALERLNLSYIPTQGNFILIKIPIPGRIVFQKLLQKGIIIRSFNDPALKYYVRITIGTKNEIKKLIKQLKKIL
ncbi:MAG: histidinol-phosphate transaminase [Spirochaetes bacterium]|nr:histidinol-phosphate transaminase [Spirochaetota bacterium]